MECEPNENSPLVVTTSTVRSGRSSLGRSGRSSLGRSVRSRRDSLSSVDSKLSEDWVKFLPPDATAPQLCPQVSWNKIKYWVLPIELFFLLGMFVYFFYNQLYREYLFQRVAYETVSNATSHVTLLSDNDSSSNMCYNQSYVSALTSLSSNDTFGQMQTHVNNLNMGVAILYLSLSGLVSLFLGPISDVFGRKPILAVTISGMIIGSICQIVIIYIELKPIFYFVPAFFFGAFGGHATLIGLVFAVVSDTTSSGKWLTVRMGLIEAALTVAMATSAPALNDWIQYNNCNFRPTVWLMFSVTVLALIYLLIVPESLNNKGDIQRNKLKDILDGFKCYLFPPYIGYSNWWRLWVVTCIISLESLTVIGGLEIIDYFLHNKPLQWTYTRIGNYGAIVAVSRGICLLLLLPLLVLLRFSNILICLIACLFAIVANVLIATLKASWEMYVAGILESVSIISFPAIRSMLSQLVPSKDLGAIFSITASLQMLTSIGSSVLFNFIYHPDTVVNGRHVRANISFWVTAGFWTAAVPLLLLLLCCRPGKSLRHPERKGLLNDDSFSHTSIYSSTSIQ